MPERLKFLNPGDAPGAARLAELDASIDGFWAAFEARQHDFGALFRRELEWDLPDWMATHLGAINPELMWEFGPAVSGNGHRLVVTPEATAPLVPLVERILERAPLLAGWEFYGYRLAESFEAALHAVSARTGQDVTGAVVQAQRMDANLISLTFLAASTTGDDDEDALSAAYVAAATLLGEHTLERWVGEISVGTLDGETDQPALPLAELKQSVEELIRQIRSELPSAPLSYDEAGNSSVVKLSPEPAPDYAERWDLAVAVTTQLELWQAAHSGWAFYDERFSRSGETFAYLKIDGSEGLDASEFADRGEIEDALTTVLAEHSLGSSFGGGTGLRYSYIDLALLKLDQSLPLLCERLRAGRLPHRSWILFFNAAWKYEWVGIYPDSPAPPMPEEDDDEDADAEEGLDA